jgi:thioredoxin reductase (NADPH)
MTKSFHTKVLIIGSGPAGYAAAIYAARANLQPILVSGMQPGGQLTITTDVENYPGFADVIQGPWLMEQMAQQAKHVGTVMHEDHVASVDFNARPFTAITEMGIQYSADSIVIATGAQARWLGLPTESKFQGFGVSGCATCDGFFFRNKDIIVVGGGNSAVEEALYLTRHAKTVTLIHRRDSLRAEKIAQDRLFAHPKVRVLWHHELKEVLGTDAPLSVTGARLYNNQTKETYDLPIDGIFIAIGHKPNTAIFASKVTMDDEGYILTTPGSTVTSVPGVFAAGDVQDKIFRQAVTAAGTGCMAALEAEKFLTEHP